MYLTEWTGNWTEYWNTPESLMTPAYEFGVIKSGLFIVLMWTLCLRLCWFIVYTVHELKKKGGKI